MKKSNFKKEEILVTKNSKPDLSRREALKLGFGAAFVGGATAAVSLLPREAIAKEVSSSKLSTNSNSRKSAAYQVREEAARQQFLTRTIRARSNRDEKRFSDHRACFHKTLQTDELGEVNKSDYRIFKKAMESGSEELLNTLPLDASSERRLANPMGAFSFELLGLDSHASYMPAAPSFKSKTIAGEMAELYWQAITRDVPFQDYQTDSQIQNAVNDLNSFSRTVGPKVSGEVTPETIFRGFSDGNLQGPYISQFLLKDIPYGPSLIEQKYLSPIYGEDFMTEYDEWLAIQKGQNPAYQTRFETERTYINNNRALAEYVHRDVLFQAHFNAAMNILSYGPDALDANNPYLNSSNQQGFVSFGGPEIIHTVSLAARVGLTAAWCQKWHVHRRLRPETFSGRLHNQISGAKDYGINDELVNSEAINYIVSTYDTALLPQCYPEGSPTHPAYPAGHAVVAGACATVLKAWVNEDFIIPEPVQASKDGVSLDSVDGIDLTLGGEINKLANNISIGRNAAGVHYRSDGDDGLVLGEEVAISILRDYSLTHKEKFKGFQLTKFDGNTIRIYEGEVTSV